MSYEEWLRTIPVEITADPLWKVEVYRLALFAADLGWHDVTKLTGDRRTLGLSDQLYRALGSVSANIAEGYSRGTGEIERVSMSMRSDQGVRAAVGTTRDVMSWATQ